MQLPVTLYSAAQVREFDRLATEEYGIPAASLMARAGAAAFASLRECWPDAQRISVVCGVGNNAGDGFVLAGLALQAGIEVAVVQIGSADRLHGAALAAHAALLGAGVTPISYTPGCLSGSAVIVDALLGTGLAREVQAEWRLAIEAINASGVPVLALDIPSGLHADTGQVMGAAVRADVTISFIALKQGMFTGSGQDYCGTLAFDDLGLSPTLLSRQPPSAIRINLASLPRLKPRPRVSHKGMYGHVLIVGGDLGMAGAVCMAGEAAARTGAGLVTVATRRPQGSARPELIWHEIAESAGLLPLLAAASVIAIGPGLGRAVWAQDLFARVLDTRLPLVVDADALNLLALDPLRRDNWVLTPHPGEAARMLGCSIKEVQADRLSAAQQLQACYGGVVVLKGAGSIVLGASGPAAICDAGNPGMASGGMGDVLTGVIAGLLAQKMELLAATRLGVCLHAAAADCAALAGERGMLASDLLPCVRQLVNFPA